MSVLLLLIPVALIIVAIAVWFFFWAVKSQQFEDLDRQGANILFDDDVTKSPPASTEHSSEHSSEAASDEDKPTGKKK